MNVIIVHGGAGRWPEDLLPAARQGLKEALEQGGRILKRTASSLESVLTAVRILEDNPLFNCGTGSALTIDGQIQMDAAVMTSDGRFGAVGAIESVRHPIDVAHKVMTETSHMVLAGAGAQKLARLWGFPDYDPMTAKAGRQLAELKAKPGKAPWIPELRDYMRRLGSRDAAGPGDTVGAIALDRYGRFAVASSTGGVRGKLPGRVGDTPVYGAGTFAGRYGAVTGTGIGEELVRLILCKTVCDLMAKHSAQKAVEIGLRRTRRVGLIAVDRRGRLGIGHTTMHMPWGCARDGEVELGSG